jgi:hypothetical protein
VYEDNSVMIYYDGSIMKVGGEDARKIFLRAENKSMQSYYEIWLSGCIHMSRFR